MPTPKKASKIVRIGGGFIGLCILFVVVISFFTPDKPVQSCAKDNLTCLGEKGISSAGAYCRTSIEKLALHDVKWTDTGLQQKFDRYLWQDKEAGIITYVGDKIEFQNGFGAFTPMTYECDLAPDNKTVLDVRMHEGRLP